MSADQTGGALIDEGRYGCVFMPPLLCENEKVAPKDDEKGKDDGKLDKLVTQFEADAEFSIAKEVQKIPLWRQHFVVAESMCTPAPASKQTEPELSDCAVAAKMPLGKMRILRMDYGGIRLSKLSIHIPTFSFRSFMVHLLEDGALLALFGVVHRDLHKGNVLVDRSNVPRIIDFNLSLSAQSSDVRIREIMTYEYNPQHIYTQVSPDWAILNGRIQKQSSDVIVDELLTHSPSLKILQTFFGIPSPVQRSSLEEFIRKSRSVQTGDMALWFKSYWRLIDSWAIGIILVETLSKLQLWPSFQKTDYSRHATEIKTVLRKMTAVNPIERIDSVQALALLDPGNYIVRKYGGDWLAKVGRGI
jgi:serine/threonine protein kinase